MKALFRKRRMDRDMADELAFHQAMLRDKLLRQGVRADRGGRGDATQVWQGQPVA